MKVVFRTDASRIVGTGHVMRCLTLANILRERNSAVSFVCREHDSHLCDLIEQRGFAVSRLPAPNPEYQAETGPAHAVWLGATWRDDSEQTRAAIEVSGVKPDWLVVDQYAIDRRWESALRKWVGRIMVIDDLADRMHDCDLLLDQNLVAQMRTRYHDKVPAKCGLLLGPEYALLQPVYAELHDRIPPREGAIRRIFIFFGGADADNLTGRTLAAFLHFKRPDIDVDVVISAGSSHADTIRRQVAGHGNIHLHCGLPTLAPLMAKADLAIGGSGATSWERLCLGLPALVVTLAENQRAIADGLSEHGLVRGLGHWDLVNESILLDALAKLLQEGLEEEWSSSCRVVVDGKGANRVCAAMTVSPATPLLVRHATLADEALLLRWAEDPLTQNSSLFPEPFTQASQRRRFRECLRNLDGCRLYILETTDDVALGQAQFERQQDQAWEVRYALAAVFRGRGLGRALLKAALAKLRTEIDGALVLGGVKSDNDTSQSTFELSGFDGQVIPAGGGGHWRISVCSDRNSWINASIPELLSGWMAEGHEVSWVHNAVDLLAGDICFFLSYSRIADARMLARHKNNLVVHASDLPKGRGWSPLTWQILEGKNRISVTLFEAAETVDSGPIYKQLGIEFSGLELIDELRDGISRATRELCRYFVSGYPGVVGTGIPQSGESTYYPRRRPADSRLDIDRPLREQFNLLRTADSKYYPAWFELGSRRLALKIEKLGG